MNLSRIFAVGSFVFLFSTSVTFSQHKYVQSEGEAAFEGYDLVSYFNGGEPKKGKKDYQVNYDGLTLFFVNMSNMQEFKRDPESYLPAYGGYCATAVSNETFVVPNFSNYTIQDDRLLFFEVRGFFNGKTEWNKDPQLYEILADKHYREEVVQKN